MKFPFSQPTGEEPFFALDDGGSPVKAHWIFFSVRIYVVEEDRLPLFRCDFDFRSRKNRLAPLLCRVQVDHEGGDSLTPSLVMEKTPWGGWVEVVEVGLVFRSDSIIQNLKALSIFFSDASRLADSPD